MSDLNALFDFSDVSDLTEDLQKALSPSVEKQDKAAWFAKLVTSAGRELNINEIVAANSRAVKAGIEGAVAGAVGEGIKAASVRVCLNDAVSANLIKKPSDKKYAGLNVETAAPEKAEAEEAPAEAQEAVDKDFDEEEALLSEV